MAAPEITPTAQFLLDEVGVAQPGDETRGYPARLLVGAVGKALGEFFDLVRDTDAGPGWSAFYDPDRTPVWALPWLAQHVGVTLTPGLSEQQQRDRITSPPAFERGTLTGMQKAAQQTLSGNQYVFLKEREGSPYRVTIVTRTSETPDAAATIAAARSQKPAGLILTHVTTTVRTWLEAQQAGGNTWAGVAATYGNWAAARGF